MSSEAAGKGPILVVDANDGPCVRSLFGALAARGWKVLFLRPYGLYYYRRVLKGTWSDLVGWRSIDANILEAHRAVPGLRTMPGLSLALIRRTLAGAMASFGCPSAVVYTLPFYAPLADRIRGEATLYFAYDAYRFYGGWNEQRIAALEDDMAARVDAVCTVSRQLEDDFTGRARRVQYLPNAAPDAWAERPTRGGVEPEPIRGLGRPIVGCVGAAQARYDWELIRKAAEDLPACSFVFLGHPPEPSGEARAVMGRRNIRFSGHVPHDTALECMRWFDVCWNPMALDDFNHRRCPLRLYDYLCTDRPVLSTGIREALELRPHVTVGTTAADCLEALKSMLDGRYTPDLEARRAAMKGHTWSVRAAQLEQVLADVKRGVKAGVAER